MRIAVDFPTRVRSRALSLDGRAVNLSRGGILFIGARPPPASLPRTFDLEIDLPDTGTPISATGEVRWADGEDQPGALGIRFTGLALAARRRLANLILRACAAM
jgi:hypothetical protein